MASQNDQRIGADADETRTGGLLLHRESESAYLDSNVAGTLGMRETMTGHERSA
jgi:hypothetical protein